MERKIFEGIYNVTSDIRGEARLPRLFEGNRGRCLGWDRKPTLDGIAAGNERTEFGTEAA